MTDLTTDELRALVEALRAPADLLQESDFDALFGLLKREYGDAASLPHMHHAGTVMQMRALWEAARAALSLAAKVLALREERERLRGALDESAAWYDALQAINELPERGGCDDETSAVDLWMKMRAIARAALFGEPQP
jgi:hypothetical protein